jgi:hypothetical protein
MARRARLLAVVRVHRTRSYDSRLERALTIFEAEAGPDSINTAWVLDNLASSSNSRATWTAPDGATSAR